MNVLELWFGSTFDSIDNTVNDAAHKVVFVGVGSELGLAWAVFERNKIVGVDGWFNAGHTTFVDLRDVNPLDWVLVAATQLRPFLRAVGVGDFDPIPPASSRPPACMMSQLTDAWPVTFLVLHA